MIALRLEQFEPEPVDEAALDALRATAHAGGYAEGHAAALRELGETRAKAEAALAEGIADIGFSFHEARTHVLAGLEPLLIAMAESLLPQIARASLAPLVAETLMPLARAAADAPVTVAIHPDFRAAVQDAIGTPTFPLILHDDPTLPIAARIAAAGREASVDLTRATDTITAAIRGFFELQQKDAHHG